MQNLWTALESHTRSWQDLDRQAVADAVWADYVSVRFARTGDKRALQFLYPYLNRPERSQRFHAIEVAGRVFEGRGRAAIEELNQREIAQRLGISQQSVSEHLYGKRRNGHLVGGAIRKLRRACAARGIRWE